jgi:2-oxoglutarate dehydrogenase E2 component (dihydrolipoamide succinyltransferase)
MPTEIKMPQLGESVTEGTVGKWLKQPGDRVEKYEALLEVTTDKVDTEVPAPVAGVLREIMVAEGQTVRVGALLALVDDDGAQITSEPRPPADDGRQTAADEHRMGDDSTQRMAGEQRTIPESTQTIAGERRTTSDESRPFVSPVVARLVAEHGLDLSAIRGSGQAGRVTKQDVLRYLDAREKAPPASSAAPAPVPAEVPQPQPAIAHPPDTGAAPPAMPPSGAIELPEDAELLPISAMRRSIAEHMVRSRRTAPHVTTVAEVDVGRIAEHRQRHKGEFERQGVKLTFTPYFVEASVAGLQAVPIVNASYTDQGILLHQRMHVGVAVALDEGLIVPVLRNADEKNLLGLARAVNDLADRARRRRLQPGETQGGTFTITNHGVGGSLFAMPIINQPQSAILGIGAIQKRVVVVSSGGGDSIAIRPMCYLSLTFDHRLIDGATADQFVMEIKRFLESYPE